MSDAKGKHAEKPADKSAGGADGGEKPAGKLGGIVKLVKKTPVLIGGVMVVEALVLLVGVKMLSGGPSSAHGAELAEPAAHAEEAPADAAHGDEAAADGHGDTHGEAPAHGEESAAAPLNPNDLAVVPLVDMRGTKRSDGRTYLFQIKLAALTTGKYSKRVEAFVKARSPLVQDRIRTVIAEIDGEKLHGESEPGLETFRRQVKVRVNELLGEKMVDEVLVQDCVLHRVDF